MWMYDGVSICSSSYTSHIRVQYADQKHMIKAHRSASIRRLKWALSSRNTIRSASSCTVRRQVSDTTTWKKQRIVYLTNQSWVRLAFNSVESMNPYNKGKLKGRSLQESGIIEAAYQELGGEWTDQQGELRRRRPWLLAAARPPPRTSQSSQPRARRRWSSERNRRFRLATAPVGPPSLGSKGRAAVGVWTDGPACYIFIGSYYSVC